MKAITIRQPYAGAVALGWKQPENRSRMFSHRGLTLIHAGQRLADNYPMVEATFAGAGRTIPNLGVTGDTAWAFGAIIAVGDLYAAHRGCDGSCAPGWAQRGQVHHLFRDVRLLARPVPADGQLGLWTPEPNVLAAVEEAMPR
ncbi:hypothetical protein [Pimelobacter simplex]|uniref:hypothetical protein n=1 Tax=Nocardioides simplex TaxID=2045 RepID=UPI00214FD691|nr:hypothetical protein [Pimelobacter simplex]UUW88364.1 hypothetical protein M0M43_21830 [Pimelobacter simplex]UUW97868.1 hypothetical protein M0M48_10475 [Pimelobacter simplex]